MKAIAIVACLAGLLASCTDQEPTIAFTYAVKGTGEDVRVSYVTDGADVVHRSVTLPWISEESEGSEGTLTRIEADGPAGTEVRCVVRYRPIDRRYGGNGSGGGSQGATGPNEDHSRCELDLVLGSSP